MTLGQRIYQLRTQMHFSQGDLADKLEVSRQSVSKWETDASVPELDKLVRLSQLFGVTLDALVTGAEPISQPELTAQPAPEPGPAPVRWSGRQIAGWALIALGVVIVVLFLALTGSLVGTIFSLPLFLCGLICLTVRRHPGLWCAWVLFLLTDGYWRYATGVTWRLIWLTPIFEPSWNYARLALGWGEAVLALVMAVGTTLCLGKKPLVGARARWTVVGAWAVFAAVRFLPNGPMSSLTSTALDWLSLAALSAALTVTLKCIRGRRAEKLKKQ